MAAGAGGGGARGRADGHRILRYGRGGDGVAGGINRYDGGETCIKAGAARRKTAATTTTAALASGRKARRRIFS